MRRISLSLFLGGRPIDSALIAIFCSGVARVSVMAVASATRAPAAEGATASLPACSEPSSEPPDRLRRSRRARHCLESSSPPPSASPVRLPIGPCLAPRRGERTGREEREPPMAAQYAIWRERAKGHRASTAASAAWMEYMEGREENKGASASAAPFHRLLAAPRRQELFASGVEMGRGKCEMRKILPVETIAFKRQCLAKAYIGEWRSRTLRLDIFAVTFRGMFGP